MTRRCCVGGRWLLLRQRLGHERRAGRRPRSHRRANQKCTASFVMLAHEGLLHFSTDVILGSV
jgi:hypothetical protein